MVELEYGDIGVLIGCVDNAAARQTIPDALDHGPHGWGGGWSSGDSLTLPHLFWLDCSNGENTGVLLGLASNLKMLRSAFLDFPNATFCIQLPAPHLQHPDLLEPRPSEVRTKEEQPVPSCAQLVFTGDQSPSINTMVANLAANYLWRMCADAKGLAIFASYCDLETMSVHSRFITPEALAGLVHKPLGWFQQRSEAHKTGRGLGV